jgi:hypothetical protein
MEKPILMGSPLAAKADEAEANAGETRVAPIPAVIPRRVR